MDRQEAAYQLNEFIKEMEHTLTDEIKVNRNYAPQVFWKNKYILEQILEWLNGKEDTEEKLGIDSVTLIKAFENGAWFRNPYYRNEINFINNLEFNIDFSNKRFDIRMDHFVKFYDYRTGGALFGFDEYGKTWALTREELE